MGLDPDFEQSVGIAVPTTPANTRLRRRNYDHDMAFGGLHHSLGEAFNSWARSLSDTEERLLDAAPAISELLFELRPSEREGTLGVTTRRIVFFSISTGVAYHHFPLSEIESVQLEGAGAALGQKFVRVTLNSGSSVRFMIGKRQSKDLVPTLQDAIRSSRS